MVWDTQDRQYCFCEMNTKWKCARINYWWFQLHWLIRPLKLELSRESSYLTLLSSNNKVLDVFEMSQACTESATQCMMVRFLPLDPGLLARSRRLQFKYSVNIWILLFTFCMRVSLFFQLIKCVVDDPLWAERSWKNSF